MKNILWYVFVVIITFSSNAANNDELSVSLSKMKLSPKDAPVTPPFLYEWLLVQEDEVAACADGANKVTTVNSDGMVFIKDLNRKLKTKTSGREFLRISHQPANQSIEHSSVDAPATPPSLYGELLDREDNEQTHVDFQYIDLNNLSRKLKMEILGLELLRMSTNIINQSPINKAMVSEIRQLEIVKHIVERFTRRPTRQNKLQPKKLFGI